jgi:hypothetical protein
MVGHPFIIYGNQFTLKYLKSLGYKTFDKWIDESYDEIYDRVHRAQKIVSELKKFNDKTIEELTSIRLEMEEICIFNKQHYDVLYKQKYGEENVNKDLEDIFLEIWEDLKETKEKKLI